MKSIIGLIAALALLLPSVFGQTINPTRSDVSLTEQQPAEQPGGNTRPTGSKEKVKPGESHTNGDGVTVDNDEDSSGNATVDPKDGDGGDETTVDTQSGFEGDISGIDGNDTVDLGSSNTASISGTGGTVEAGGGSTITISNTGGQGSSTITVNLPSGGTVYVPPGAQGVVVVT